MIWGWPLELLLLRVGLPSVQLEEEGDSWPLRLQQYCLSIVSELALMLISSSRDSWLHKSSLSDFSFSANSACIFSTFSPICIASPTSLYCTGSLTSSCLGRRLRICNLVCASFIGPILSSIAILRDSIFLSISFISCLTYKLQNIIVCIKFLMVLAPFPDDLRGCRGLPALPWSFSQRLGWHFASAAEHLVWLGPISQSPPLVGWLTRSAPSRFLKC